MNTINKDWDDMQLAMRNGYIITLKEIPCMPGYYCLAPELQHPRFVINALPGSFKKEEVRSLIQFMKAEFIILPADQNETC
jgi:hypothetical protein